MLRQSQGFIAGEWRDALSGKTFKVHNPFNNEEIENVADFDVKDVQDAIDNAHHTFKTWRKSTFKKRSALLKKIGDLMLENKEELGMILTSEQGKPLPEATGEVAFAASFFHFFSEECKVINTISGYTDNTISGARDPRARSSRPRRRGSSS